MMMSTLATRLASIALAAAGGLHAVAAVEHERSSITLAFFVVVAIAQIAGAIALALRPTTLLRTAALVTSLGLILLWATSRTVGVSIGHVGSEAVGALDGFAVAAQLLTVLAIASVRSAPARLGPAFAAVTVPVAMAVAFAGSFLPSSAHDHPPVSAVTAVTRVDEPSPVTSPAGPTLEQTGIPAAHPAGHTDGHGHVDKAGSAQHAHP